MKSDNVLRQKREKEDLPQMGYCNLKLLPELHSLIGRAADQAGLPMNEWVVQVLARHLKRPELGVVPRKIMGRPRRELAAAK
jgi:predicted HicB family RNase H-like nuclease